MTTARNPAIGWWAAVTILVSAFLLFQVQPVISKTILPWFGGSPAVWTTCVLFFQLVLLGGYAYAHALIRYVSPGRQGIVHGVLLVLSVLTLPITPTEFWKPNDGSLPALRILVLLLVKVGLPYFLLSSSGPLVQAWFSRAYPGASPYRLYALSNIGSLLALLTYPVVFEPIFAVNHQGLMWSGAFIGFALLAGSLAWMINRLPPEPESTSTADSPANAAESADGKGDAPPATSSLLIWISLPALASMLLLATTNHLCQDIAVVPFMWIVPLSLYLISFILCFDSEFWYQRRFWGPLGVIGILVLCVLVKGDEWGNWPHPGKAESLFQTIKHLPLHALHQATLQSNSWASEFESNLAFQALVYVVLLFIICMLCHGELVKQKPQPQHLTLYYLMISAGGALGGLFVALICPFIFKMQFELSLGIVLGYVVAWIALVNDGRESWLERRQWLQWIAAVMIMGGVLFVITSTYEPLSPETEAVMRNFYGTLTVKKHEVDDETVAHRLVHGGILHGYQFIDPIRRLEATTYYVNESGAGVAVLQYPRTAGQGMRVAVVGLGSGTMAAHAQQGDVYRFYEIDPKVIVISDRFFTFRRDAEERGAKTEVILGDARIRMEKEADQKYDVIILDAFSGDAIPAHLLTVESLELYKRHLRKDADGKIMGVLAVHISNKHLDLAPVVAALARRNDLLAIQVSADESPYEPDAFTGSDWILLTQNEQFVNADLVANLSTPLAIAREDEVLWTDTHSSLLPILKSDWVRSLRERFQPKPKEAETPAAATPPTPVER
ncbi:spermidine synthase [Anatilimnocola aggregata]|uniref:Spermidine synthase n=1 Tax=Anatilimnocola aggregata TaxID=2528021 RepID=A0A517YMS6_9BACT|nr:fused MFS/spermidine synthase [Anatilimnocola aggregata]QDU31526.1 spermidine synthase [Anatilimnocola aggregata]